MTGATTPQGRSPWGWIPTLYFAQGLPYAVVMTLSVVLYKNLGLSNADIALYTSWLYLPWVVKPLWSPLVELLGTRRTWIVLLQLGVGAALACVALTLPAPGFVRASLACFWLMAFASATHDIAADGFYMLALSQRHQAAFVGVRSTFYRLAMIAGQGGLVVLAGRLTSITGDVVRGWQIVFGVLAVLFLLLAVAHHRTLPRPATDVAATRTQGLGREFLGTFAAFFRKPGIALALAFLLTYRLGEGQALKLIAPFLLDPRTAGGLALDTEQVGWVYGTLGVAALTLGGIVGGVAISRHGLRAWLWPMLLCVHVPNLAYVALAVWQPADVALVAAAIAFEQFGYGFGFAAYLMFMILVADGPHKTAHYALCTGFMALGMMLPGMASGWVQQQLGYVGFFAWVCLCTLPSVLVATRLRIDTMFDRRSDGA